MKNKIKIFSVLSCFLFNVKSAPYQSAHEKREILNTVVDQEKISTLRKCGHSITDKDRDLRMNISLVENGMNYFYNKEKEENLELVVKSQNTLNFILRETNQKIDLIDDLLKQKKFLIEIMSTYCDSSIKDTIEDWNKAKEDFLGIKNNFLPILKKLKEHAENGSHLLDHDNVFDIDKFIQEIECFNEEIDDIEKDILLIKSKFSSFEKTFKKDLQDESLFLDALTQKIPVSNPTYFLKSFQSKINKSKIMKNKILMAFHEIMNAMDILREKEKLFGYKFQSVLSNIENHLEESCLGTDVKDDEIDMAHSNYAVHMSRSDSGIHS